MIEDDEPRAGLERAEDADEEPRRPAGADADRRAGRDPEVAHEVVREAVGAALELGVGDRLVRRDDGNPVGRPVGLLLDERVHEPPVARLVGIPAGSTSGSPDRARRGAGDGIGHGAAAGGRRSREDHEVRGAALDLSASKSDASYTHSSVTPPASIRGASVKSTPASAPSSSGGPSARQQATPRAEPSGPPACRRLSATASDGVRQPPPGAMARAKSPNRRGARLGAHAADGGGVAVARAHDQELDALLVGEPVQPGREERPPRRVAVAGGRRESADIVHRRAGRVDAREAASAVASRARGRGSVEKRHAGRGARGAEGAASRAGAVASAKAPGGGAVRSHGSSFRWGMAIRFVEFAHAVRQRSQGRVELAAARDLVPRPGRRGRRGATARPRDGAR